MNQPGALCFIAILPGEPLSSKIRAIQEHMAGRYHSAHALQSPPHITLQMPFRVRAEDEPRLHDRLGIFSTGTGPFEVGLQGFGHFHDKVLFIAVKRNEALLRLQASLAMMLNQEGFAAPPENRHAFTPHITIASRDLSPDAFRKAWSRYGGEPYDASFPARQVTLLVHDRRRWHVKTRFPFGRT